MGLDLPLNSTSTRQAARRRRALACAAVAVLAGLVYLNALHNLFIYDDHRMVVENLTIQHLYDIKAIVLHEVTRPIVNLSYAVDRAIWGGPDPFGFHLTNVLLHSLNVILLCQLAWRLVEDRQRHERSPTASRLQPEVVAFTAAVLLAVHPMMTEAVGYISGRSDVLCATFFLLGVLCARRWMLAGGRRWWLLSAALWVAALATKEIAVVFPLVLVCYDWIIVRGSPDEKRRTLLKLHVPFIGLALLAGAVRLAVLILIEYPGQIVVRWQYILLQLDVVRRYIALLLVPEGQSIFHAVPPISMHDPRALLALGLVGLIVAAAWRARRVEGLASFGVFWFLLLLVPSSMLFVLDRGEPMAEHRVYLASCGLFLAAGLGIGWLNARTARASGLVRLVLGTAFAVAILALGERTLLRNVIWGNPVALWREAVEKAPDHWLPHLLLGEALHAAQRREEAMVEYATALTLRPQEPFGYQKLALCLVEMGRFDEASATLERLRSFDPRSTVASAGLGAVAMLTGQPARARRYFLETLEYDPRNVTARQSLAMLDETEPANHAEALRLCEEIQRLAPDTPGNDDCIRRNRAWVAAKGIRN